jgi:hypothetical protein
MPENLLCYSDNAHFLNEGRGVFRAENLVTASRNPAARMI